MAIGRAPWWMRWSPTWAPVWRGERLSCIPRTTRGIKKAGGPDLALRLDGPGASAPVTTYEGHRSPVSGAPMGAPVRTLMSAALVRRTLVIWLDDSCLDGERSPRRPAGPAHGTTDFAAVNVGLATASHSPTMVASGAPRGRQGSRSGPRQASGSLRLTRLASAWRTCSWMLGYSSMSEWNSRRPRTTSRLGLVVVADALRG